MSIVSSAITSNNLEIDGRRRVDELHVDDTGAAFTFSYLAPADFDITARLAARAAKLPDDLRDAETAYNVFTVKSLGSRATPTLKYSTAADNVAAVRAAYKSATNIEAIMIGDYLSTLSNAQLQAAFGLTAGQVATQRTNKLTPAATEAASIRAAVGA